MNSNEDFDFDETTQPEEAFHIEVDLYEIGEYSNLLVVPCNDTYIVISNNEHLCTLIKTCDEPECWEQQDGGLDEEVVEKLGAAIGGYISSM
ncbi:hypothetical protein EOD41_01185 [Mucilaginibacter limnophilus]|uniref:Uncharacterized protein n=1 Tax=Mucilaginibacter limnophilus TaxID=1932778 RepID=A0A437MY71_9SPHI|nr:hypothetical protein [Mucilaginibacter limnophilus]RVU02583.1 hypothetical protein EOD41_01185 [Mucilaginibacter limnophilus]